MDNNATHDCDSCGKPRALAGQCFCPVCKPIVRENTHPPRLYRVRGAMGLPTHYHAQLITTDERFEFVSAAWPSVLASLPDNWRLVEITPAKPAIPEGTWSGRDMPVPDIGTVINVTMNGLGLATVLNYRVVEGYLGLMVRFHNPPAYYTRQNNGSNPPGLVFGAEIRSVTE